MKLQKLIAFLFVSIFLWQNVFAQSEVLEYCATKNISVLKSENQLQTSLKTLPFFDDFAYSSRAPIANLWEKSDVYVNSSFAKNYVTIGVATFDAMNSQGKLHDNVSTIAAISDVLTSLPINLKTFENVYASDKLYRNDGSKLVLLDENYYLYNDEIGDYVPVTQGIPYSVGDTLYIKNDDSYTVSQIQLYDKSGVPYEGSDSFEHIFKMYSVEDSIALSFYYQSGGVVDNPESTDSLVLEFYAPYDTTGLFINEISASGVELYNATDSVISLDGYFLLIDTLSVVLNAEKLNDFMLTDIQIMPFQHAVISCEKLGVTALTRAYAYLYSKDTVLIDSVDLNEKLGSDIVYARMTDGSPTWSYSTTETLGECNPSWDWIWSTSKLTDDEFVAVYLPIEKKSYLVKGFRFRFKNYTSLSKDASHARNEDFWHLDMVWLNANRSVQQKNVQDVAFVSEITPLYTRYKALPMSHFSKVSINDFRLTVPAKFANFDTEDRKLKFNLAVKKNHTGDVVNFTTYETDLPAKMTASERDILTDFDVDFYDFIAEDTAHYASGEYDFLYYFTDNTNPLYSQYRWNDTCRAKLILSDYYAYDDGTPEAGYGLRDAPMGRVAYKYDMLQPDTLRAISMYFNPTMLTTNTTFNLCVWAKADNGEPGELLYKASSERVKYADGIFAFVDYEIEKDGILSGAENLVVEKSFFIGWEQPNDVLLNVGIDLNTNLSNRLYYNLGFEWEKSVQSGALMMRPVLGERKSSVGVKSVNPCKIAVYPTIANESVTIDSDEEIQHICVFAANGTCVLMTKNRDFSVYNLPNGIYSVVVKTKGGRCAYGRFVVAK